MHGVKVDGMKSIKLLYIEETDSDSLTVSLYLLFFTWDLRALCMIHIGHYTLDNLSVTTNTLPGEA